MRRAPRGAASVPAAPEIVLALAVLANLGLLWAARHFPYEDPPNHLARAVFIERAILGHADAGVLVRAIPTPYVATDLLTALLAGMFGPAAGLRVLVTIAAIGLPLGLYVLLRAAAPERRGWAIVGALLTYSSYFLVGLLAYVLAIALAFIWLAVWWGHRDRPIVLRAVLAGAGASVIFLFHVWGALLVTTVVLVDLGFAMARARAGGPAVRASTFATPAAVLVGIAIPWTLWRVMLSASAPLGAPVFRPALEKVAALTYPFWGVTPWSPLCLALGYTVSLAVFMRIYRTSITWDVFTTSAAVCVGLYVVFPVGLGRAWDIDVRWMLPAALLPFCATSPIGRGDRRRDTAAVYASPTDAQVGHVAWALAVPFIACLAYLGTLWHVAVRPIDRQLDDYDAVLRAVPRGTAVLPLVADHNQYGRFLHPYRHFALWRTARGEGPVSGLFATDFLADVVERAPRYSPSPAWGAAEFSDLDWNRVGTDYDYIIVAGDDPRAQAIVAARAHRVFAAGDITLYRVRTK